MNNISKEDYLSIIFKFQDTSGEIKPIAIAKKLKISQAAVTDMLKKLAADKYILYEKYRGIHLTRRGEEFARNMVRRHRIWEVFLQRVVGMRSEEHTSELQSLRHLVCRLLL